MIQLSASSIQAFKDCPTRYRLRYVERLRPTQATESLRVGTNWHLLHEIAGNIEHDGGSADEALSAAIEHLNEVYTQIPDWADPFEWAVEREILAVCFAAYRWYYQDDGFEILASEKQFDLPLYNPRTGLPYPRSMVQWQGMIDKVIRADGRVGTLEYKSTSEAIDDTSDYWVRLRTDDQVSIYALALRETPPEELEAWGVRPDDEVGPTLYDVWRKPKIRPAKLSQKATDEFLVSGEYHGTTFEVARGDDGAVFVNGDQAESFAGKRGFAIRETVSMFGARLLAVVSADPEQYFRRKWIARTQPELVKYRAQLHRLFLAMDFYKRTENWFQNRRQCRNPYPCDMRPICDGPDGVDAVCDGETEPTGFSRQHVALTVGRKDVTQ